MGKSRAEKHAFVLADMSVPTNCHISFICHRMKKMIELHETSLIFGSDRHSGKEIVPFLCGSCLYVVGCASFFAVFLTATLKS